MRPKKSTFRAKCEDENAGILSLLTVQSSQGKVVLSALYSEEAQNSRIFVLALRTESGLFWSHFFCHSDRNFGTRRAVKFSPPWAVSRWKAKTARNGFCKTDSFLKESVSPQKGAWFRGFSAFLRRDSSTISKRNKGKVRKEVAGSQATLAERDVARKSSQLAV